MLLAIPQDYPRQLPPQDIPGQGLTNGWSASGNRRRWLKCDVHASCPESWDTGIKEGNMGNA